MTDVLTSFHESLPGMVQPIEGLVLSVPVLVEEEAQGCHLAESEKYMHEHPATLQLKLEREPAQLEALYRVALHRLEPVGLVVLWPETRG